MKLSMVRYLGWVANAALFTLCCFLVADTANAIIAALLSQSPAQAVESDSSGGPQGRAWEDRQQITKRNLFHSAKIAAPLAAAASVPTDEELKETQLPLKLWGTIAAENPELSWASVEETGKGEIASVRVGDQIQKATIVGIERRRVVLLENGSRRSLSLDDDDASGSEVKSGRKKPSTRKTASRTKRRSTAKSPRKPAGAKKDENPGGNASSLYSQARIVPQIDPQTNVVTGLQLSAIQTGSQWEEAGVQNGEVITEIDGTPVSELGPSTKIMAALTDPEEVHVVTESPDGQFQQYSIKKPN
jgi:general secretion pathway protein C